MKRSAFGIVAVLSVMAVWGCAAAKGPARHKTKTAAKVKAGALCPQPVAARNAKSAATKAKSAARAVPKVLPRLVDLGSTTCIPCKMMTPILDQLSKEYKTTLKVEFIDVREVQGAAEKYKIQAIPTQIIYDAKGKELYRHQGYYPKEDIVQKLKELGIKAETGVK
jgi:thioredoxin 1